MLARLMPREIKADVNTAYSLIQCLREIDEREANAKESWLLMTMVNAYSLVDTLMEMAENTKRGFLIC